MKMGKFESLIWFFFAVTGAQAVSELTSGPASCDPPLVGAKEAELIVLVQSQEVIDVGSFLKVTVPTNTTVKNGVISCGMGGWDSDEDGLTCEGVDSKHLYFEFKDVLAPYQENVFNFYGAFNAPLTSESTDSFKLEILGADKTTVLAETNTPVLLNKL